MTLRVFLLGALLLSACGLSPSNSDVARALTQGDPLIGKVYQITNIRRSNGYERPDGYVVQFAAEIQVLENPADYFGGLTKRDQTGMGALAAVGLATGGLAKWGLATAANLSATKNGDVIPFSGTVILIKSEQGWILRPE